MAFPREARWLGSHPSWKGLLFSVIFDRRYSLFSHIGRAEASKPVA